MSSDSNAQIDIGALVHKEKLQPWLDANIPELGSGPLTAKLISGGTSNVILGLNRGEDITMVMRRPPADPPPGSKKAIEREATLLSALGTTSVPHPKVFGKCFDPELIGSSFYIMELVNGWAPELNNRNCLFNPPFDKAPLLADLAHAMVDGLIALANVD
ncbi:MAG: phosphotransferase, partial [Spongiibacteraceae bacterium]